MPALILRFAAFIFAMTMIAGGLIVLPLPIPFGAIMILTGCAILISISAAARAWLRKRRGSNPRFNRWVSTFEDRIPGALGRALRQTTP